MDDSTYTFIQHQRESKATARGARSRKSGAHSRKVTLPSDHLTPAQKRRLNGTVQTYEMNKPHTKGELILWPLYLRKEYMQKLLDTYVPSNEELGDMLGYKARANVSHFLTDVCDIHRHKGGSRTRTAEQAAAWLSFVNGSTEPAPMPEPAPEPEPLPEVHSWPGTITNPAGTVLYDTITVQFTGTVDDLIRVIQTGPIHLAGADTYTFTIRAARKKVD